jgi:stalled ribosome rescue protein Dom34
MSVNIGIWLDRSNAMIVRITGTKCAVESISSDIEIVRHPRGGTQGHCTFIPERRNKLRRQTVVRRFYQKIIQAVRDAGAIFIIGPGFAKVELVHEIDTDKRLRTRVAGIETVDKMSMGQFEDKVRGYFAAKTH